MRAAGRAGNLIVVYEFLHLLVAPAVYRNLGHVVFLHVFLDQLICAETFFTFLTVHQRVAEAAYMTGCDPCLRVHQDSAVHANIIGAFLDEFLPPCFFYVIFQLNANRTVIPCVCQTAVNFRAGIDETPVFCQRNNFFHRFYCHFVLLLQKSYNGNGCGERPRPSCCRFCKFYKTKKLSSPAVKARDESFIFFRGSTLVDWQNTASPLVYPAAPKRPSPHRPAVFHQTTTL